MKTVLWVLAIVLVAAMSFYAGPVLAEHGHGHGHGYDHDNDCTGDGDCARDYLEIAPKGKAAEIPVRDFMVIAKYFNELMSNPPVPSTATSSGSWNILAASLFNGVDDPALNDEISDFFVVDMRIPYEFCQGHLNIPNIVNIPYDVLAKPENLALLPLDKPILLICNGGFNASVAQGVLRIMGYDAWALRGGMLSLRGTTNFPLASAYTEYDPVTGKETYTEKYLLKGLSNKDYYIKSVPEANRPVIVKCQ